MSFFFSICYLFPNIFRSEITHPPLIVLNCLGIKKISIVLQFQSDSFYFDLGSNAELQNKELLWHLSWPNSFFFIGKPERSKYLCHRTYQCNDSPCHRKKKRTSWEMPSKEGTENTWESRAGVTGEIPEEGVGWGEGDRGHCGVCRRSRTKLSGTGAG